MTIKTEQLRLAWKNPVRVATTQNVILAGLGTAIDGVTLSAGDRVLVKDQTIDTSEHGIYLANASSWTRARDADASGEDQFFAGIKVYVQEGTKNAGEIFTLTTTGTITIGSTLLTFENTDDREQSNVIYVGKHGDDGKSGRTPSQAVLTLGQAETLISAESPTTSNRWTIHVLDAGTYTEATVVLADYTSFFAPHATLTGELETGEDSVVHVHRIDRLTGNCIQAGANKRCWIHADELYTAGASGVCIKSSGGTTIIHATVGKMYATAGYGIQTASGSEVTTLACGHIHVSNGNAVDISSGNGHIDIGYIEITGSGKGVRNPNGAGVLHGRVGEINDLGSGTGVEVSGTGTASLVVGIIDCNTTYNVITAGSTLHMFVGDLIGTIGTVTGTANVLEPNVTGGGNVSTGASITDHTIVRGDGGGNNIQDTGITIDDSDNITMPASTTINFASGGTIDVAVGDLTLESADDVFVAPGSSTAADLVTFSNQATMLLPNSYELEWGSIGSGTLITGSGAAGGDLAIQAIDQVTIGPDSGSVLDLVTFQADAFMKLPEVYTIKWATGGATNIAGSNAAGGGLTLQGFVDVVIAPGGGAAADQVTFTDDGAMTMPSSYVQEWGTGAGTRITGITFGNLNLEAAADVVIGPGSAAAADLVTFTDDATMVLPNSYAIEWGAFGSGEKITASTSTGNMDLSADTDITLTAVNDIILSAPAVGIGQVPSSGRALDVNGGININSAERLWWGGGTTTYLYGETTGNVILKSGSSFTQTSGSGAQAFRTTNAGLLLVGTHTTIHTANTVLDVRRSVQAVAPVAFIANTDSTNFSGKRVLRLEFSNDGVITSSEDFIQFRDSAGQVGTIDAEVNYTPFTGSHVGQITSGTTEGIDGTGYYDEPVTPGQKRYWEPGMIVVSTGVMPDPGSLSNAFVCLDLADADGDAAVMGVFVYADDNTDAQRYTDQNRHLLRYNALGEGKVLVTDKNGNVDLGDYIESSTVEGYGQKQTSTAMSNSTVAKCTEQVDWASITDTIEGHKYKLIACTYHCG